MFEEDEMTPRSASRGMRVFTIIWFGQLVSLIGSGLTSFALGVWVYQRTGSVTLFTMIAVSASLPGVLLSPLAGALVDRWDRRTALIVGDLGSAILPLCAAFLLWTDQLAIWHIYILVAISASFAALQFPAFSAAVTLLVSKEQIGRANGMVQTAGAVAQIAAPVLAGVLIVLIQIEGVILFDFLTFLFSIGTLLLVRIPRPMASAEGAVGKGSLWAEALHGYQYVATRPGLFGLLIFFAITNFMLRLGAVLLLPLLLTFNTPRVTGLVLSIAGFGMLAGGVTMSVWGGPKRRIIGVFGFELLLGLSVLLIGLQASTGLITVAGFMAFFCIPMILGCSQAIWQVKIPPDLQGRVFSTRVMIAGATAPLAFLLAGPLSDKIFEPLLAVNGAWAGTIGQIIGVGPGRGIGFIFILAGILAALVVVAAYFYPRLRLVEKEIPDAIPDTTLKPESAEQDPQLGDIEMEAANE